MKFPKKCEYAIHMRHNWVAHKNKDTALGKVDLPEVNVTVVGEAADLMENLLYELAEHIFPDGIIGKDGSPISIAFMSHPDKYLREVLSRLETANKALGLKQNELP